MIEVDKQIYSRMDDLTDFNKTKTPIMIPRSVCVIGVGGVGGWVAFKFPLIGINEIILVDPDVLEESNLNRLPYKVDQIGMEKVYAMQELIRERRMCDIKAYPMKWEDLPSDTRKSILNPSDSNLSIIIDCRDTITPLDGIKTTYITGGYDGTSITIHKFPDFDNIWGSDEVRYRVTPSYLIPPDLISTIIINFICYEMHHNDVSGKEGVVTFDAMRLLELISKGAV